MKSLKFFKPALATTLTIVLGWLLSVRPAEAGYTVTLQQVGPDVVATGSGAIDLTGQPLVYQGLYNSEIHPGPGDDQFDMGIVTGPTSSSTDTYNINHWISGPRSFGSAGLTLASSGSGHMVGTFTLIWEGEAIGFLIVPRGYVSGTFLSNSATYSGKTFATLGVTPGTYVWTWGTGADQNFTLQIPPPVTPPPVTTDFNNDGKADFVLFNASTRQTVIWYMNNNVHVATATGPTPPVGWQVVGIADFNRDGHPDYLLFSSTSRATVIWYMDNNVRIGSTSGPTLPGGWTVEALADVNLDGSPDYLLFNANTGGTVVWYMRNNVHIGAAPGPAIPAGWTLAGVGDFNGDGHPDYLLFNANSGATVIWYMNNNVHVTGAYGPTLPAGWSVAGVADFNGDGHPDYLLFNEATRATVIWYMNNNIHVTGANGPTLPEGWSVVAP